MKINNVVGGLSKFTGEGVKFVFDYFWYIVGLLFILSLLILYKSII